MTGFEVTVIALGIGLLLGLRAVIRDFWRWWRNERRADADDADGDWPYLHPRIHAAHHDDAPATRHPQSERPE